MRVFDRLRARVWWWAPQLVALLVVCVYAFPGYMAFDSLDQLAQVRVGNLTDWHPPLMSALWGLLDRIVAGPALMLLLQCITCIYGLFLCLRRRLSDRTAALVTLLIFISPPSLAMMAVILKDSLMCGLLLLGIGCVSSERRGARIAGLVALGCATALRHNALAATLPLLVLVSPWPAQASVWRKRAIGALVALGLFGAATLVNRALTDIPTHPFHLSVAPMDFIGTLEFADDMSDAEVRELLSPVKLVPTSGLQARARTLYDPNRWWGAYLYGDDRFLDEPSTPEARSAITTAWWRIVRTQPGAYLRARLDMFRELLGLTDVPWQAVFAQPGERWSYGAFNRPAPRRGRFQRMLGNRMIEIGTDSLLFRPYVYVLLALVLLVLLRRDPLGLGIVASGTLFTLALLIVTPAPDIRYTHWLMVTVMIGLAYRFAATRPQAR